MFDGKEINTIHDLIANFKLDTYEQAMEKRNNRVEDPDFPVPGPKEVDGNYAAMIMQHRPKGAYYEHSHGDKILYLQKVDKINYDLVDAHRMRKE